MKKNNNSLLVTILGGVLFCFTFLGMAFIFTNNTRIMRGNTSITNPFIGDEEITLGDTCSNYGEWSASGSTRVVASIGNCGSSAPTTGTTWCKLIQTINTETECAGEGLSGVSTCYVVQDQTRACLDVQLSTATLSCFNKSYTGNPVNIASCSGCTITEGNAYFTSAGNYTIGATPDSGHAWSDGTTGTKTCQATIAKASNSITASGATIVIDTSRTLVATASFGTVTYSLTSGDSVTLSGNTVTGVKEGSSTITASVAGTNDYEGASTNITITVAGNISGCVHYEYSNSGVASCTQCLAGLTPSSNGTQCIIGANCMSECIASGNGTSYCATYRCSSQNSGLQSCGNYQTYDDDSGSCVCINNNYKPLTTGTGCVLKECSEFSTSDCPSSRCHVDGTSCVDTEKELGSVVGGGDAYVTPNTCKTFLIQAKDTDGENIASTWSISGSHYTASCTGSSSMCSVKVCGWGCNGGTTVKVTANYGSVSKTANIVVHSYANWSESEWGTTPANGEQGYSYDGNYDGNASNYDGSSLNEPVCYGYSGASRDPDTGDIVYEKRWNRCCGSTAKCYIDDDNVYHWTKAPDSSWKVVSKTQSECTNADACFETPTGERVWGKHYEQISQGYILITSIKDSDICLNSTPDDACYVNDNDETDYVWSSTAPVGYTKADDIDDAKDCQPAICYLNISTNEYEIGQYENDGNYAKVYDENDKLITDIDRCKPSACYRKTSTGDYVWGYYGGVSGYELITGINDAVECSGEVVVPPTGINLSKVIYICMAVLMACGVGFIYYSSVVKKNN